MSPGTYTPTFLVRIRCSQHGPLRVTAKYWLSTFAEIADGETCIWVSVRPGSARFTNSGTNCAEHNFTNCKVLEMRSASPTEDRTPRIQRERPMQRWSRISPS